MARFLAFQFNFKIFDSRMHPL